MALSNCQTEDSIQRMLHPTSIAVVGATERLHYGGRFLRSVMHSRNTVRVYPVNPKYDNIMGMKCYRSVTDLPEAPDLVGIIVPSNGVVSVLNDCARIGAGSVVIISGGFSERGTQLGSKLQSEIRAFANQSGIRICGPNCLGIANVAANTWATSSSPDPNLLPGPVALVSQSGASAYGPLVTRAKEIGMGYSYIISTGNEADLEASDFIGFLLDVPTVKVIACFIEGFKDGRKFLGVANKALRLGKAIIVIKVGQSKEGSEAALSHTAALTGSDRVHNGAFKQFGVLRADDYDDLIHTSHLIGYAPTPPSEGIGIVSHSGGVGSLLADHLGQVPTSLPAFSLRTQKELKKILGHFGSLSNPADITGHANRENFGQIISLLEQDPAIGTLLIATAGTEKQARDVIQLTKTSSKPTIFFSTGGNTTTTGLDMLSESHIPVFKSPLMLAKSLGKFLDYHHTPSGSRASVSYYRSSAPGNKVKIADMPHQPVVLGEYESKDLLSNWGVNSPRQIRSRSAKEAIDASVSLGFPVAVKLDSPSIPHKTEAGVVFTNVTNKSQVRNAFNKVIENGSRYCPESRGSPVVIQEMVTGGTEIIVGLSQDPTFGTVLLFGLGGVFVDVLDDVSIRICPINEREALRMIDEISASRILRSFRGRSASDIDALVETLVTISDLGVRYSDRGIELDINPLLVLQHGQGVIALDALIKFHK